jgi:ribosomal protein S18 acetylase RimI-like enzyme
MIISKPLKSEVTELIKVTQACAKAMISNGIYQWNDDYPSAEVFEKDIELNQLWVLKDADKIVGSIVISCIIDEEYKTVDWLTPTQHNCYIHRLAIHPDFQGQGLAQQLMTFAENYAIEQNFISVRLDTFSVNDRNNRFYQQRGYQKLGEIFFPRQSEYSFYCYELVLEYQDN